MIPIAVPLLGKAEAEAAAKAVLSGWISQGPEVVRFEHEFAEAVGARHACAVSNCTTALHLALLAAGVGPGDEVITVSSSFIATANVIRQCGALPVFVDIGPGDFNIDPEADRLFRLWRQHGMSVADLARHRSDQVVFEDYPVSGFNYRMTDIQAAIGRLQLTRLPAILERRRALADRYRGMLAELPGVIAPVEREWARSNWQSYCVRLPEGADQKAVMGEMLRQGVATRRGIMCAHLEAAYADMPLRFPLPESERARNRCILLPLFPQMSAETQDQVVAALGAALGRTDQERGGMTSVDVIIPCYRYAHYLPECVASIQAQQGVDYRILIIDDCSPDNTADVAAELAASDHRISSRRHPVNRGHIATYNEGLDWIEADHALLLSADDWVLPGALARAAALLDAHPDMGFVFGRAINVHENQPRPAELAAPPEPGATIFAGAAYMRLNSVRNPVATCTAVVRTAMQKRIGAYRPDLPHSADMEMWMRFAAHGSVGYINAFQGAYRQHDAAMSLGYYRRMLLDLEQRKTAFDAVIRDYEARIENPAELQRHLYRGTAKAALDAADKALLASDREQFGQLRNFAARLDPGIRWTKAWQIRSLEQRLGPAAWNRLRSASRRFGVDGGLKGSVANSVPSSGARRG